MDFLTNVDNGLSLTLVCLPVISVSNRLSQYQNSEYSRFYGRMSVGSTPDLIRFPHAGREVEFPEKQ